MKIIGLGGVGSIVARYSALFMASLQADTQLVLVDGDAFEPANASRMFFFRPGNKADTARDDLVALLGDSPLMLASVGEYITPDNIDRLVREGDTVLFPSTITPQILFANLTVAAAMLNTFWLHVCQATHYAELCFDIADGLMRPVPLAAANIARLRASTLRGSD